MFLYLFVIFLLLFFVIFIFPSPLLAVKSPSEGYSANMGFAHLAAGLSCGLSSLGAGLAIGIVGDYGVRAVGRQPKVYIGFILILIFAEAIGLFGLIVALVLSSSVTS
jgi:V-type H+-transporting ATPase proteolipid subunit